MALIIGGGTSTGSATVTSAAVGAKPIGSGVFGGGISYSVQTSAAPVETDSTVNYITPWGFGKFGQRIYAHPLVVIITEVLSGRASSMEVTFYNKSGAVLGRLSTEVQKSIIRSIEWQHDRRGVGDATLRLSSLPVFPIIPFAQIGFRFGRSNKEVYRGYVRIPEVEGSTRDEYIFKCTGLREQLNRINADRSISGPQDVGLAVKDLFDTDIEPQTDIKRNPGKLNTSTGVLHQNTLDLGKDSMEKVIESLAIMVNGEGGVDEEGDFFFDVLDDNIKKVFHVGFNIQEFEPVQDVENVFNSIIVKRNKATGSGESGWTVASVEQDTTSQAKFGFREKIFKVPGFFNATETDVIAENLLADLKDPKFSAKTEMQIQDQDDLLDRGLYRFIAPLDDIEEDVSEADSLTGWAKVGSGDLALSIVTPPDPVLSGSGALKLTYTSATNDRAEFTPADPIKKKIKSVRVYVRAAKLGTYLTFGFGESSFTEFTRSVAVNVSNQYQKVEVDVSDNEIDELNIFAIRIDDTSGLTNTVFIDRVQVVRRDRKHYDMRLEKVKYKFVPNELVASAEFGPVPPETEGFITELIKFTEDNESTAESR